MGNTKSPVLDYDWEYYPRPIPKELNHYFVKKDKAMPSDVGGIDLNAMQIDRQGKAIVIQFDAAQLNAFGGKDFGGFRPSIISVIPVIFDNMCGM